METRTLKETRDEAHEFSGKEREVFVDLTVEGETPGEIKGGVLIGLLLPAVQKVRE